MDERKICFIIFGITSDLVLKKIVPSLTQLHQKNILPQNVKLIGIGRRDFTSEEQQKIQEVCREFVYLQQDMASDELYQKMQEVTADCDNRLIHLATFPNLYTQIVSKLKEYGFNKSSGWTRLMIEKPIGDDFASAKQLLDQIYESFEDNQIFLVDHYLGKEVLQNMLVFRFGNNLFEHLINNQFIDHIQILAAESVGIEQRGRYYDTSGALKDVGQNHLLQMAAFSLMEQPQEFSSQAIHQARLTLLRQLRVRSETLVLGQYQGYLEEKDVDPHSQTETFFSFQLSLDNHRFQGVPITLIAGKKLAQSVAEISIIFKQNPDQIFASQYAVPNILRYKIQPDESIEVEVVNKIPGHEMKLATTTLKYSFIETTSDIPDAYEKLLADALEGDQTFFPKAAEVKTQWEIIDQLKESHPQIQIYEAGSWGPHIPHFHKERA